MVTQILQDVAYTILRRAGSDDDTDDPAEAGQKEIFTSWALFIIIVLLITALFTSYILQQKKIQAVHETVVSIFAGRLLHIQHTRMTLTPHQVWWSA